jgi:protein disulfide-isomerase
MVGLRSVGVVVGLLLLCAAEPSRSKDVSPATHMPYDETADARADIAAAMARASTEGKAVLLTFGANWCPDCRALDAAMTAPPLTDAIAARFVVVDVDIGNWNKNLDVVDAWGNPIAKGIPSIVVVDAHGAVLYATKAGELANARRMGADAFVKFFTALPTAVQ